MSTLETNSIGKYSGNNVSLDDSLNLKSYSTTDRNALTSVAGDMIYNSTLNLPQVFNGTSWVTLGNVEINYLVIAGGGSGGFSSPGAGGAGGYRSAYNSESSGGGGSAESAYKIIPDGTLYTVTVGAGGVALSGAGQGNNGSDSVFAPITSIGGGGGGTSSSTGSSGGSGGGSGQSSTTASSPTANQGFAGGFGNGGGGGAGSTGFNGFGNNQTLPNGGLGGSGVASTITGSSVTRASGGSAYYKSGSSAILAANVSGGGGGATTANGVANTGGGGRADGGAGGSGVVILRYPNTFTISQTGLTFETGAEQTTGSDKYVVITAGTGTVSWS